MKFATTIVYAKDPETIARVRPTHREYLTALKEQGNLWASGPFEDDSGALIIYEADDRQAAEALIANDPFNKAGVFESYTMRPWRHVL